MSKIAYLLALLLMLSGCKSRARVAREQQSLRALSEVRDTIRIRWWSDKTAVALPEMMRPEAPPPPPASSGEAVVTRHRVETAQEEASRATEKTQRMTAPPAPLKRQSRFLDGLWTGVGLTLGLILVVRIIRRLGLR